MFWAPLALLAAMAPQPDSAEQIDGALDHSQRMTIPISVNGSGPYDFTIDTGANRSVVSDTLATALDLPAGEQVTMQSITGAQQVATVKVSRIRFGTNELRSISAPVLPERALGSTGFLGTDLLAGQSVVLDFRLNRILLDRSQRTTGSAFRNSSLSVQSVAGRDEPGTITVVGRSRFGQLILTDASVNGVKVYAIIDTGAQNTVGNAALRRMLLGSHSAASGRLTQLVGVTGGSIPAEMTLVPRIRLGGIRITNMPVAYADADTFRRFKVDNVPALLVGMDVLRMFHRVAVDFGRREVRFQMG